MGGPATSGDFFRPPPIGEYDSMREAGREIGNRRPRRARKRRRPEIPTDCIWMKNSSGAALAIGRVVEIGTKLLTAITAESLWFDGIEPDADGTKAIAIARNPVPSNDIDIFQVSGVCLAQVDINDTDDRWADVTNGSTLLSSNATTGRVEILQKLASGTGEKQCLVRIGTGPTGGGVPKWQTFTWDLFSVITGTNYLTTAGVERPPSPGTWEHPDWQIVSDKITCQNDGWYLWHFEAWMHWSYGSGGPTGYNIYGYVANTTSGTPAGPATENVWLIRTGLGSSHTDAVRVSWTELRECEAGDWLTLVLDVTPSGAVPQNKDARITIGERIAF